MPIQRLPPAEQAIVATHLLVAAQQGDPLALQTLITAEIPSAHVALAKTPLPTDPAGHLAMLRVRGCLLVDPDALDALARSLPQVGLIDQMLALDTFARTPGPDSLRGLVAALQVDEVNVRQAAFGPLLKHLQIPAPDPSMDRGPLSALFLRLVSELAATWRPAAQRLRHFSQAKLVGTPDPLDAPYTPGPPTAFQTALDNMNGPKADPIEPSLLLCLEGDDRAWVEASLLSRIGDRDLRAMDAAAAMRVNGARPAIEEARRRFGPFDPQLAVAAEANLAFLRGT